MVEWVLNNFLEFVKYQNINLNTTIVTILGYTFKENCSDIRNTKIYNLIKSLKKAGIKIKLWDPFISEETRNKLRKDGIDAHIKKPENIQLAFVCVYHQQIIDFLDEYDGVVYDFKKVNIKV
jgi:UDP-N-acetyl-D-galactosamine dehydrogenase